MKVKTKETPAHDKAVKSNVKMANKHLIAAAKHMERIDKMHNQAHDMMKKAHIAINGNSSVPNASKKVKSKKSTYRVLV